MNDIIEALESSVRAACAKHAAEATWNAPLWTALEEIGVTTLAVLEDRGGSGGDVATAVAVLETLGEHAAAVPVAETALLAGWLLATAGAPVPAGPLTAAVADRLELTPGADDVHVTGTVPRVPWARCAEHLVLLAGEQVLLLRRDEVAVREGRNLAGEPRDDVVLDTTLPTDRVLEAVPGLATGLGRRAALARSALIAGAARRALELSITYAGEREQFGRPIGRFQAVQQHLATMAGEVLLAKVAVEAAAVALDQGSGDEVAVAAAKTVASQAAGVVATLAHQIHGALGYTEEHPLRLSSTRLWAWRDEAGNEAAWSASLGGTVLAAGPDELWPLVTGGTR
ncbi:MAG: acyl-CoA/acyl-ACP dehydrogenase [Nocardioidaceae bacterium]|nr:acyl-CoA/acyl-ACP dehydrogenase [Nocardioidaceae bacterium]